MTIPSGRTPSPEDSIIRRGIERWWAENRAHCTAIVLTTEKLMLSPGDRQVLMEAAQRLSATADMAKDHAIALLDIREFLVATRNAREAIPSGVATSDRRSWWSRLWGRG